MKIYLFSKKNTVEISGDKVRIIHEDNSYFRKVLVSREISSIYQQKT